MLDAEGQWSEALATNNIRGMLHWQHALMAGGDADVEDILPKFSCWVQRTSEFAQKELLTLCFSRCRGLWMFLDRSSFTRIHLLLQRLRNLLSLAQWAGRQHRSTHLRHGVGVPCVVCSDACSSSHITHDCWNEAQRALKQHIWLGQLVQWWGIMGLLPKFPEAQEVKRLSQMWKDMQSGQRRAASEALGEEESDRGRCASLIQGLVMDLHRHPGSLWTSGDGADSCYPPPDLQALLKLLLEPHVDVPSVQAVLMYFILDVANFLQCKDDLLQSFCLAFTIPPSHAQQLKAFWMFDHGHTKASMELLLSPRSSLPSLSWQHRCILNSLLRRKQPQIALRYLQWTKPAIQTTDDAKLCTAVLLQCSCVSDVLALLKRGQILSEDHVMDLLQTCERFSLREEALKRIAAGYNDEERHNGVEATKLLRGRTDCGAERPPCPLSARLYQAQRGRTVASEDLLELLERAVREVRKPRPKMRDVVWPVHVEEKPKSRETFLWTRTRRHLTLSHSTEDAEEEREQTTHTENPQEDQHGFLNLQFVTQDLASSSEAPRSQSVSPFTSASSSPLLKSDPHYVYERTVTLQRISSLLTDGENHSSEEEEAEEEEEESGNSSPTGGPELTQTLEGATGHDRDTFIQQTLSVEEKRSSHEEDCEDVAHGPPEASTSTCVLDRKVQQRAHDHRQEDASTDLHQSLEEPRRHLETPVLPSSCFPADLQTLGPACSPTAALSDPGQDTSSQPTPTTEEGRVSSPFAWRQKRAEDGSWTQEVETLTASGGILSATESGVNIVQDNRRHSFPLNQPYSCSQVDFMGFITMKKGDNADGKQEENEEPAAGWSGSTTQGAIRSARTRSRQGKRLKRT